MTEEELAEKIAGYAKIRLSRSVEGNALPDDWLLSEKDRVTIVKMLRDPTAYADVCLSEENDRLLDALIQIRGFAVVMNETNWRDLKLHIERQCSAGGLVQS